MYLEYLSFVLRESVGIHAHLTFEQSRFKRDFILMNQKSRQLSKNDVEKYFFKLMNNSNFGYDCRNNLDNCKLTPIFDELGEITYINRYHNIFDEKVSAFVTTDLVKQNMEEKFNDKLAKLNKEDQFYSIKLETIKNEPLSSLEAAEKIDGNKKKNKKRTNLVDYSERKTEALTNQKIKSLIDFHEQYSASIKSLSIQKNAKINLTTRFLNGKMLMFSKVSIKSFVYDMIDVFMFPNEQIKQIYQKYNIIKCLVKQNLTDTDSTSIFFVFICDLKCDVREDDARDIIVEVMLKSKIFDRLDSSHEYYAKFNCRNTNLKKELDILKSRILISEHYYDCVKSKRILQKFCQHHRQQKT